MNNIQEVREMKIQINEMINNLPTKKVSLNQKVKEECIAELKKLLRKKSDPNQQFSLVYKGLPLLSAIVYEHHQLALQLLEKGANPNLRCPHSGETPAHHAVYSQDPSFIRLLSYYGAQYKTVTNSSSYTPFGWAGFRWNDGKVKVLIETTEQQWDELKIASDGAEDCFKKKHYQKALVAYAKAAEILYQQSQVEKKAVVESRNANLNCLVIYYLKKALINYEKMDLCYSLLQDKGKLTRQEIATYRQTLERIIEILQKIGGDAAKVSKYSQKIACLIMGVRKAATDVQVSQLVESSPILKSPSSSQLRQRHPLEQQSDEEAVSLLGSQKGP